MNTIARQHTVSDPGLGQNVTEADITRAADGRKHIEQGISGGRVGITSHIPITTAFGDTFCGPYSLANHRRLLTLKERIREVVEDAMLDGEAFADLVEAAERKPNDARLEIGTKAVTRLARELMAAAKGMGLGE